MQLNSANEAWLNNFIVLGFSTNFPSISGVTFIKGKPAENKRGEDKRQEGYVGSKGGAAYSSKNLRHLDLIPSFTTALLDDLRQLLPVCL